MSFDYKVTIDILNENATVTIDNPKTYIKGNNVITTIVDAISLIIYFSVATVILNI